VALSQKQPKNFRAEVALKSKSWCKTGTIEK